MQCGRCGNNIDQFKPIGGRVQTSNGCVYICSKCEKELIEELQKIKKAQT